MTIAARPGPARRRTALSQVTGATGKPHCVLCKDKVGVKEEYYESPVTLTFLVIVVRCGEALMFRLSVPRLPRCSLSSFWRSVESRPSLSCRMRCCA
jgi:hypothetical protein